MLPAMFVVSEEAAAAIRAIFNEHGELSAAIELRRLFPGIIDNENARLCTRAIAGWQPLPPKPVYRSLVQTVISSPSDRPLNQGCPYCD
jgi:hypothetical protein